MTQSTSPALPAIGLVEGNAGRAARDSFFAHHGVWAPGVRAFRRMGFGTKALCISMMFLIPITLLTWSFLRVGQTSLDDTAKERRGVQLEREVLSALRLALSHQLASTQAAMVANASDTTSKNTGLDDARGKSQTQLKRLLESAPTLVAEFGSTEELKAVKDAAAVLLQKAGSAAAEGPAHETYVEALLQFAAEVGDNSGLALDPELASYYLISAAVLDGPALLSEIATLRRVGTQALATGAITNSQTRQLLRGQPLLARRVGVVNAAYAKVAAADKSVVSALKHAEALKLVEAFSTLVDTGPLDADGPKGDAASFAVQGTAAIEATADVLVRTLDGIDRLLDARSDGTRQFRHLILGALVVSLLLAAYFFYSFYKVLNGGLEEVERHLLAISEGDLTTHPHAWGSDEPARLMSTLQTLQISLRGIVSSVRESADSVVSSSTQVSAGAMDLSARTENAASNLEETAAAMEELGVTVRQTADSAVHAATLASNNSQAAQRTGEVIERVVITMQEINASSSKIGEIIGTIDGIAFQTNILALNAAVEAARAGEQGRGFAVVAAEVRALAQRSATAAREIKTLITASMEKVAAGTQVAQGAGNTMRDLVNTARQMNNIVSEISTAASEQSKGIAQVGEAVQQLDEMTQQNAALVEETSAASSALAERAGTLLDDVGRFNLPAVA
jgi:methyl-accepting chemotaxis protein